MVNEKILISFFIFLLILPLLGAENVTNAKENEEVTSQSFCGGAIPCSCGDTVTEDYMLNRDLTCSGDWGLKLSGIGVTLDCAGHSIKGFDRIDTYGIYMESVNSNTITNCQVLDFMQGIVIRGSSLNNILNNTIVGNSGYGITLSYWSNDNIVKGNVIYSNRNGVWFYSNNRYNILQKNKIYNNAESGMRIEELSNYNSINENNLSKNEIGINIYSAAYNTIWNNTLENNFGGNSYESSINYWNSSEIGNYWGDFESNIGFPVYYEIGGPGSGIDRKPVWDTDDDGIPDKYDNCRYTYNPTQQDSDLDLTGDACDNCPFINNMDQKDRDSDTLGDTCDNCDFVYNVYQRDFDLDGVGDWCDNCPLTSNSGQEDVDINELGDVCEDSRYMCKEIKSLSQ